MASVLSTSPLPRASRGVLGQSDSQRRPFSTAGKSRLCGSLPNYPHSVSDYGRPAGCVTQQGRSDHGVSRSGRSSRPKVCHLQHRSETFTCVDPLCTVFDPESGARLSLSPPLQSWMCSDWGWSVVECPQLRAQYWGGQPSFLCL